MQNRFFKALTGLALLSALAFSAPIAQAGETVPKKTVIELFTSQGCSSCPPADKILADYAKQDDVLALSWHVDYWNYLGWKDTFSKAEFTKRQREYGAAFRQRSIYTPEAVINGRDHTVGSRRGEVAGMIATMTKNGEDLTVPISVKKEGDKYAISTVSPLAEDATLWLVYYDRNASVAIERGENRGRTITYHNIVRYVSMLGMAKQGRLDITLSRAALKAKGHDACAFILQKTRPSGLPGPIIGATVVSNLLEG